MSCVWGPLATPVEAHDPDLSGIRVLYRRADTVVNVTTALSRLARAEGADKSSLTSDATDGAIRRRLRLRWNGQEMTFPARAHVIADTAADMLSWQVVVPGTSGAPRIDVGARLYPEDPASRTIVAFVQDGQEVGETILDSDHPALTDGSDTSSVSAIQVARRYMVLGVTHIFGGPDHVLFVLGLLLLGGSLRSLFRTITAFTLAHSVTLTLAVTGIVHPSPRIVEPLIALSLVAIAFENLRRSGERSGPDRRPLYALGFGLIHGFGFAGALAEVGLAPAALGPALASFNIGVEIGQAAIIAAAFPLLSWLARTRPAAFRALTTSGALVIALAGSIWFVMRLL